MADEIKIEVKAADGAQHTCKLQQKANNENGQLLYAFLNEATGASFTMVQSGGGWQCLNGGAPEDCVSQLGHFIDQHQL